MSGKPSPDHNKSKRMSLRLYASRVFQESYVSVLSSAVNTSSIKRRVFKVIAFFMCLTGFLYQTTVFLSAVLKYPTAVDIDVFRPKDYSVPAYTFCNNNGINKRIFCEMHPNYCEVPSKEFCKKYKGYCGENGTLVPQAKYFNYQNDIEEEELFKLNEKLEDFVVEFKQTVNFKSDKENITGPHLKQKGFEDYRRFRCYSVNDRVDNNLEPLLHTPHKIVVYPVHKFRLRVREDEMFLPGNRPGVIFALHSPFEAVNPFETGIFMKPGRKYMIFVTMEEEILLKSPYDTDCTNYTELWERNGRSGPRTQKMCKHNCLSDLSVQCFNCIVPVLQYPRPERLCNKDFFENETCPKDFQDVMEQCETSKCKEDCRRVKYYFNVQERFVGHFDQDGNPREGVLDHVLVEIYLEGDEVVQFHHSPRFMIALTIPPIWNIFLPPKRSKLGPGWRSNFWRKKYVDKIRQFVEVFSNIGGFIGCWLGINLLDMTDVFEGLFRVFRYALKNR